MTKEERAVYMRRYRAEHREQINANRRYWYKQNRKLHPKKEKVKLTPTEYQRMWYEKNRNRWNAYQNQYQKARRKALAERSGA